jgi:hypothetical protein
MAAFLISSTLRVPSWSSIPLLKKGVDVETLGFHLPCQWDCADYNENNQLDQGWQAHQRTFRGSVRLDLFSVNGVDRLHSTKRNSRIGWRSENATACLVRPTADPDSTIGAGSGFVIRNEFIAIDDPAPAGRGNLFRGRAIILTATPLAGRVPIAARVDPRIMRASDRGKGGDPQDYDCCPHGAFEHVALCFQ